MVVQHNLQAMNSNRMLGITQKTVAGSTEKLSSGYKINRAADDAAGLSISEKMRKQIRGLDQASANAEDGISSVQTAEGALQEVTDMLQRMNELAVQAANGTNSTTDRQYIQDEIDQLVSEIDRVAETTKFNETYLLKGDSNAKTSTAYTTNFSTTFTRNVTNGVANTNTPATSYKYNYVGTQNLYIVNTTIASTGSNVSLSATKVGNGDDITDFMMKKTGSLQVNSKETIAFNTTSYVAFVSGSLDSQVYANGSGEELEYGTNGSDIVAGKDLFIYDTDTETITHVKTGEDMSKYINADDKTMKDQYRKLEVYEAKADTANGITAKTNLTDNVDKELEAATSKQQLYDADGNEVSGIALNKYFDEAGEYKGGLFTTNQARGKDEVFKDAAAATAKLGAGTKASTIGAFITQSSTKVAGDLSFSLHVGADSDRTNKIATNIQSMSSAGLGIDKLSSKSVGIVDETGDNATDAIDVIANALQKVSTQRSALGAVQNRLEHTIKNLDNVVENTQSAESAIRDTDMAEEMVKYSNANILSQAGQSMLAQANQSNQGVLSIL